MNLTLTGGPRCALDLDTIYATYYQGYGSTRPQGVYGEELKGWTTPFEDWPEAVRKVYTHDPAGAEALLDAAGYPRGADGTRFKTVLNHNERYDTTFAELVAAQWGEVGVDVEVRVTPIPELVALRTEGTFEMISAELGGLPSPSVAGLGAYYTHTSWRIRTCPTRCMTPCMKPSRPPPLKRNRSG